MSLSRRWAWVLVPMLGVLILEALQDGILAQALPSPLHIALLGALLLGGAVVVAAALFRRFDRQAAGMANQNAELEARAAAAEALQRVSLAVAALGDLDRILATVSEQARSFVGGDIALICLATDEGTLAPRAHAGPYAAFHPGPASCPHPRGGGSCPLLLAQVASPAGDARAALCAFVDSAFLGSAMAVPICAGERVLGTLAVSTAGERDYRALEISTLEGLASQTAVAIENARLYRRVRELGMVEERNRIARELHDGLAQVLGYVSAKSEAAVALLDAGRTDQARDQVRELGEAARSVYVDVRDEILGLGLPLEPGDGIVAAIREYARRYGEASKIPVDVVASADAERTRLAPAAEAQGARLVQEALTNVRKHAAARRVVVDVRREDGTLAIEVRDDGLGFDPATPPGSDWPRYGLATMRERAASVAGQVDIVSRPGAGTRVRLRLPIPLDA